MTRIERKGWVIVAGLAVVCLVALGSTLSTIGLFLEPLDRQFHRSDAAASGVATLFMLLFQGSSPFIGWLLDRLKVQIIMACGVAAIVLGYAWASLCETLPQMYAAMALSGLGVGASTYLPCAVVTARWITRHRGLALGIVSGASSLGGAAFVPLIQHVIDGSGWRTAMQLIAGAVLLITMPLILFLIRARPKTDPDEGEVPGATVKSMGVGTALRCPTFLAVNLLVTLANLGLMGAYFHVVPFLQGAHYPTDTAAALYAATNITSFIGYLVVGFAADRSGTRTTLAVSLGVNAASILVLLWAGDPTLGLCSAITFVLFWGATIGAPSQLSPVLILDTVGPRRFSTLFGITNTVAGLISSLGPTLTGLIYANTGSYTMAFESCAALTAGALVTTLLMRERNRAVSIETGLR